MPNAIDPQHEALSESTISLEWEFKHLVVSGLSEFTFGVESSALAQTQGDEEQRILSGTLTGGGESFEIQFRIRSVDGDRVKCAFHDMPLKQREAMARLREQLENPIDDELHSLSYDELAQGSTKKASAAQASPAPRQASNLKKLIAMFFIVGAMAGIFVWVIVLVQTRSTVAVSNSVLVGNYQPINTPFEGQLTEVLVSVGDHVEQGQTVAVIANEDVSFKLAEVEARLARARRELSAYQSQADEIVSTMEFAKKKVAKDLVVAEAELDGIQADLDAAQSQVARLQPLIKKGNIGAFEYDEAKALFANVRAQRTRQKAVIETLKLAELAANEHILVSPSGVKNPLTEVRTKIELAQAAIEESEQIRDSLVELDQPIELLAPASGTVYAMYRRPGEYLKVADEAMAISLVDGGWASGHVSPAMATDLKPGQPVEIEIPSMGIATNGTLEGIGHRSVYGRGGYNADFRGGPLEVPIRVSLDDLNEQVPSGLRLNMTVRVHDHLATIRNWVHDLLGESEGELASEIPHLKTSMASHQTRTSSSKE